MGQIDLDNYEPLMLLAADLVNSYDPTEAEPEKLRTPADLATFLRAHGEPVAGVPSARDLDDVRALRPQLRIAFEGDEKAARAAVEALLAQAPGIPALATDEPWRLVLRADRGPIAARVGFAAAFGLARFAAAHGRERLRRCAAQRCEDVFVDLSRNGSRRYCSAACSSRTNVAAFRRRAREGDS